MSARRLCTIGLVCCALGLPAGHLIGQPTSAPSTGPATSQPAGPGQPTDFNLEIVEVIGPVAELEKMTVEELAKDTEKQPQPNRISMQLMSELDLSRPTQFWMVSRIPVDRGPINQGRGRAITYSEMGGTMGVSGRWENDRAEVCLRARLGYTDLPGRPDKPGRADRGIRVERTVEARDGKPVSFKLQDGPTPTNDKEGGEGHLFVATLMVSRHPASQPAAGATDSTGNQQAHLELEMFVVSADREKIDKVDWSQMIARRPSGKEILQELEAMGKASRACDLPAVLDLTSEQNLSVDERVPVVLELFISPTGTLTPSVAHEKVGTHLRTEPGRWERSGDQWVCDLGMRLDTANVGESGVKADHDLLLPTFAKVKYEGQRRFQSGRAEYFFWRAAPVPPTAEGRVSICIARMVLTRGE